jgi:hypothetical protein
MKPFFALLFLIFFGLSALSQETKAALPDSSKKIQIVEAACGQCQLGLPGKSCDLAVRINGLAYFVDGTNIDSHGDAHAKNGFCNAIRKAEVQGELVNARFKVTYFKLVPKPTSKVVKIKKED